LGARILFHFFVILLPENLVVSDLFCTFAIAIEKSSGDDELGQLRRLTAADRTAKTAY
jgi:hypothetical protein